VGVEIIVEKGVGDLMDVATDWELVAEAISEASSGGNVAEVGSSGAAVSSLLVISSTVRVMRGKLVGGVSGEAGWFSAHPTTSTLMKSPRISARQPQWRMYYPSISQKLGHYPTL
jgi:hypothetical protein